jgi:hypothetical protein
MGIKVHNDSKELVGGLQEVIILVSRGLEVIHLGNIYARMIWEQDCHKQHKLIRPFTIVKRNLSISYI